MGPLLRPAVFLPGLETSATGKGAQAASTAAPRLSVQSDAGADPDASGDVLLVTLGAGQAVRYQVSDHSVLHSWFAPSYLPLTSPVQFDGKQGRYAAVLDGTRLLTWKPQPVSKDTTPSAESKLERLAETQGVGVTLTHPVRTLLNGSSGQEACHALFEAGDLQPVQFLHKNPDYVPRSDLLPRGSKLVQSALVSGRGGGHARLFLVHHVRSNKLQQLFLFRLSLADTDTQQTELTPVAGSPVSLPPSALAGCLMDLRYYYVDKDGGLYSKSLWPNENDTGEKEERQLVVTLPNLKADDRLSLARFDDNYLAILGSGTGDKDGSRLLLVNVAFSLVVDQVRVKAVSTSKAAPDLVGFDGRGLFYKHGQRLAQVSVGDDLPRSLASILALQRPADPVPESSDQAFAQAETNDALRLYQELPELFRRQEVAELGQLLDSPAAQDMPELLVLSTIEFLLQLPAKRFPRGQVEREALLDRAFLGVPVTDTLMRDYLGHVKAEVVFQMLDFLNLSLKLETATASSAVSGDIDGEVRFQRLIQWLSLILDAHYCGLMLAKEERAVELLTDLSTTVANWEKNASLFASLMPMVQLIEEKKYPQKTFANKTYCIEVVDL